MRKSLVNKIFLKLFLFSIHFVSLISIVNLLSCGNTNKADYQDNYNNRLIFSILMTPTPDPKTKCIAMMTEAANCLPSATDWTGAKTGDLVQSSVVFVYNIVPKYNLGIDLTYANYCSTDIISTKFSTASEGYKDCVYQCQKDNYTNNINLNQCSQKVTENLITDSLGIGQNLCFIKCSKVTNN
jgi:hypothetical protein